MRLLLIVGLLIVLPDVTSSQSTHEENAAPAEPAIENQIESLLELGKSMLRTAYHETSNRDSAKVLFQTDRKSVV